VLNEISVIIKNRQNDDLKERGLHDGLPAQVVSLLVGLALIHITPEFQNVRAAA
jgi:hypothetical protein